VRPFLNALRNLDWAKKLVTAFAVCAMTSIASPAQTFTTVQSFDGTDGNEPLGQLVQATNGNLYGTTFFGGAYLGGTLFSITPTGTFTTIYLFCSGGYPCSDGRYPNAALVQATNGNLYGTTSNGANGGGTVFEITPSGTLTTLYSFCAQTGCTDGANPAAALVQATSGNLYGTTSAGGANGDGTVFEITPSGTLTTLYSFCSESGCPDGLSPNGLVQATNGNLYGTTFQGGANDNCPQYTGCGTVFEITPTGTLTTVYSFCPKSYPCTDGVNPNTGLIQATNGNLYGTTSAAGAHGGGTVFRITPSGTFTTLYSFCSKSGCADGFYPGAGLVQASDGNLYGTTSFGGANGYGTVFKMTLTGVLTTLYSFCPEGYPCSDGFGPSAALVEATNGDLYGTNSEGGANSDGCSNEGCGTVFSLSVGLQPFVKTLPTSGKVGAGVKIMGTSLTGATSVTFNGTPASFKVPSSSEITVTVPKGATTGIVQVLTPGGKLSSNVPFRVP
jgi:uncharacterized repeat protein (TIGR03803 family)